MKNIYLVGSNIKNSLSPLIHNTIYRELGINASYSLFQTDSIKDILGKDFFALNITTPFKQEIIPLLDCDNSNCFSVNSVISEDNKLVGYSTDGLGFLLDVKRLNLQLGNVLILGAGGAAHSIAFSLKDKAKSITIYNKTSQRAIELAKKINAKVTDLKNKFTADLVINTTSIDANQFNVSFINCYDLRYSANISHINGLGMLIYQAILSNEIFFKIDIDLSIFDTIYKRIKDENN